MMASPPSHPSLVPPKPIVEMSQSLPSLDHMYPTLMTHNAVANPAVGSDVHNSDQASQHKSPSPEIPHTTSHDGATFDLIRPDELGYDIPTFGERKRIRSTRYKKCLKRKFEEDAAAELEWERKRRDTIEEKLFNKTFTGYTRKDMHMTEDGLSLPELPAWLNATRERQADGSPGVYLCRPNEQNFRNRFQEIIQAMEPIGVEIGVAKIVVPAACLDEPILWSSFQQENAASPALKDLSNQNAPISSSSSSSSGDSRISGMSKPRRGHKHANIIPSTRVDKIEAPRIYTMDQTLPLHPLSKSNLAPIFNVESTERTLESGTKWRRAVVSQLNRERRIAMGDPKVKVFSHLGEDDMVARGRKWSEMLNGCDRDGITKYSSDNDATPELRAFLGLGDPHLTELPGNVIHESRSLVSGIHTPYLYIGRSYTLFALHAEDYNALSLNYQHMGTPKTWRVVCPRDFHIVENFVAAAVTPEYAKSGRKKCSQFVRHASIFLPGKTLETAGVRSILFRQNPGELVITWPLAYHEGWNEGINVNEACGYGNKNWRKVFAAGEELEGEEAVYRPCNGACGPHAPVILRFDREGGAPKGPDDEDGTMVEGKDEEGDEEKGDEEKGDEEKGGEDEEDEDEEEDEEEDENDEVEEHEVEPMKLSKRSMSTTSRKRNRGFEGEEAIVRPIKVMRRSMSANTCRKSLDTENDEYIPQTTKKGKRSVPVKTRKRSRDVGDDEYTVEPAKGRGGTSAKIQKRSHDDKGNYTNRQTKGKKSTPAKGKGPSREGQDFTPDKDILACPAKFTVAWTGEGYMVNEKPESVERIIDEYEELIEEDKKIKKENTFYNERIPGNRIPTRGKKIYNTRWVGHDESPNIGEESWIRNNSTLKRKRIQYNESSATSKQRKIKEEKMLLGRTKKGGNDTSSVEGFQLVPLQTMARALEEEVEEL